MAVHPDEFFTDVGAAEAPQTRQGPRNGGMALLACVLSVAVVGGLVAATRDHPGTIDAVASAPAPGERVSVDGIPAAFESDLAREELLYVASLQSDGLLVPTWLPAERMTIGRSTESGDGAYDLWFVTGDERYVHVVARSAGVAGSPLVEVSGFTEEAAALVRASLRVLDASG